MTKLGNDHNRGSAGTVQSNHRNASSVWTGWT